MYTSTMKELVSSTEGKTFAGSQVISIVVLEFTTRDGWTLTPWAFRLETVCRSSYTNNKI